MVIRIAAAITLLLLATPASAQCWRGNECRRGDYECIREVMKWEPCAHHQADGRGQPYVDARKRAKRMRASYYQRKYYDRMWRAPRQRARCAPGMLCGG